MNAEFAHVFQLTPAEKLQLVEELWDDLASVPGQVPVHDWQKEELARRRASHLQDPGLGSSWEEAKQRIRQRHDR